MRGTPVPQTKVEASGVEPHRPLFRRSANLLGFSILSLFSRHVVVRGRLLSSGQIRSDPTPSQRRYSTQEWVPSGRHRPVRATSSKAVRTLEGAGGDHA